ncbi:MAG: BrnT family toxin [Treponema sp.]|jgi:hypothetical protein|nr:BrnT family toxin [Treponema sp.]
MKYKSDILGMIHENAAANYEIGAISETRMQEYNEICLIEEPETEYTSKSSEKEGFVFSWDFDCMLRSTMEETRWEGIGALNNLLLAIIFTEDMGNNIRLISARKATKKEKEDYRENIRHIFGT